jgi:hypothetical protein
MSGFALNVGVEHPHNLAWKLAAVLKGRAPNARLGSRGLHVWQERGGKKLRRLIYSDASLFC